jgi:hypoxanthine phosphoribosyltransferase
VTALSHEQAIGAPIYSAEEIASTVERLAEQVAADHRGQPLLLLGVLKGALCFTTDLARRLACKADGPSELVVDYVCVERYGAGGTRGAPARLALDSTRPIEGANVVVADGIADEGQTLAFLGALLECRRPASLRNCVLFDKRVRRGVEVRIDYLGLPVPNRFVIGYGLDYQELYRNLPYLAELREGQTV